MRVVRASAIRPTQEHTTDSGGAAGQSAGGGGDEGGGSTGLAFTCYSVNELPFLAQLRGFLESAGRYQSPSLPVLREGGVLGFAWVSRPTSAFHIHRRTSPFIAEVGATAAYRLAQLRLAPPSHITLLS